MPDAEGAPRTFTARDTIALVALALFALAATVGGFLVSVAAGCYSVAGVALVVAVLVGWQPR